MELPNILKDIQAVESNSGNTSLVTFTISGGSSYALSLKRVNHEIDTATNIKSRV